MKHRTGTNLVMDHIQEHSSLYIFHAVLFLMGVVFGAILVNSLSLTQKEDLFYFLQQFFGQIEHGDILQARDVFIHSFQYNSKFIGLMWILGISMIGLPIIMLLLFVKGMVVGFSVGFLVQQMGWHGFFMSLVSVLPQNMIIIPLFIASAVITVSFSMQMIKKLFVKSMFQPFAPLFIRYCLLFGIMLLFLAIAAFIEGYITPYFMRGFLQLLN
ncbi:MAG: stage II sporulation protein M [Caldibacillus sp.]